MTTSNWTVADMPHLEGKTAIVTGATAGLGLVSATELAARGASVTMAVRDVTRGERAARIIRDAYPGAVVSVAKLDLASLASIREFSSRYIKSHKRLDILMNNAGIMGVPQREVTADGFEAQFGTNHLGHFALTGLLLPLIKKTSGARIVTVSSNLHKTGVMNFDDLMGAVKYKPWAAYGQSKLANLLFTSELQRRLVAAKVDAIAAAAHPGWSNTSLMMSGPMKGRGAFMKWLGQSVTNRMAQSASMGALNQLYAATVSDVEGNDYIGPKGKNEQSGYPHKAGRSVAAKNTTDAKRLWDESEKLTGVSYL
ncbi:MAG: oxidoreductase [Actinobacteria bacterium]|nr:oxidoreductase [Actinomycetota bacterium]